MDKLISLNNFSSSHTLHAVQARTYDGGQSAFVTSRGQGISKFLLADVLSEAAVTPVSTFGAGRIFEGQDVDETSNKLYVVEISNSTIHEFDLSAPLHDGPTRSLQLQANIGALHLRCCATLDKVRVATVSVGFMQGDDAWIALVDVERMQLYGKVPLRDTGVRNAEGMLLIGDRNDTLLVGGYLSNTLAVVDLNAGKVVATLRDPLYNQLVGTNVNKTHVALGLWGAVGGVALFDISAPHKPRETLRIANASLGRANRVKLIDPITVALPLEQKPVGGVAVVSLDPSNPFVSTVRTENSTCYTVTVDAKGNVIAWGFNTTQNHVFAVTTSAESTNNSLIVFCALTFALFMCFGALLYRRKKQQYQTV